MREALRYAKFVNDHPDRIFKGQEKVEARDLPRIQEFMLKKKLDYKGMTERFKIVNKARSDAWTKAEDIVD